jgi:hypothetical protein
MGLKGSKPKLSKEDLEFLKKNTNFTEEQIKEWYKGFVVSFLAQLQFCIIQLATFPSFPPTTLHSFSSTPRGNWVKGNGLTFTFPYIGLPKGGHCFPSVAFLDWERPKRFVPFPPPMKMPLIEFGASGEGIIPHRRLSDILNFHFTFPVPGGEGGGKVVAKSGF